MRLLETFEDNLTEGVYDKGIFKAIFLAGGGGSGKSFVARNTMPLAAHGLKMVNSDNAFEYIQKKSGGSLNMMSMNPEELESFLQNREKAKNITDKIFTRLVNGRVGVVIDGTGRDYSKVDNIKRELESVGYDTAMVFVNTSKEVALARNNKRERKLDNNIVVRHWNDVQNNIGKFQQLFGRENFIVVDNTAATAEMLHDVFVEIKKFAERPIRSQLAREWIAKEKEIKSRKS